MTSRPEPIREPGGSPDGAGGRFASSGGVGDPAGVASRFSRPEFDLKQVRSQVAENLNRVAALGEWHQNYDQQSVLQRLPHPDGTPGKGGFDAGVACSLDLIPPDRQALSAKLHAAWTPETVTQIRRETMDGITPNSETEWWLAACEVCDEDISTPERFQAQIEEMKGLQHDPSTRAAYAAHALEEMSTGYEMRSGDPWATRDGGMQGAYIAGHNVAAAAGTGSSEGDYFLGTYHPSLGLETFDFAKGCNPVHGSPNFAVFNSLEEHARAAQVARFHLR